MDPFARALGALFRAPGSAPAVYTGADGVPVAIRVIRSQPDIQAALGKAKIVREAESFDIQRSDVAEPRSGARLAFGAVLVGGRIVGGDPFELRGAPMIDVEGLTWTCGAVAVS